MGAESIEASFLSIFALISFFIFLIISKFSVKIKNGVLLDRDFNKPQAFHIEPLTRSGGIAAILSLSIFFGIYYLLYSKILYEYIIISFAMFLIGFLDDLKINIRPIKRLLQCYFLFTVIYLAPIKIQNIDLPFLVFYKQSLIILNVCFTLFSICNKWSKLIDGLMDY